ncbi:MAG: glycosyltransferase family 4 protein, partial [Kiritimatiellales bacterium]
TRSETELKSDNFKSGRDTGNNQPELIIVGDGPEREALESLTSRLKPKADSLKPQNIHFFGKKPKNEVLLLMRHAQFFVFPSVWYETFGLTVVEAGLQGVPALISNQSVAASFIKESETGLCFKTGDVDDLADKLVWAFSHPAEMERIGAQAKQDFEAKYSAEVNYQQLMTVYNTPFLCRISTVRS